MSAFLIVIGLIAVFAGGALLAGFPGYLLAGGFACLLVAFLGSIERSLSRLAKRWAPE